MPVHEVQEESGGRDVVVVTGASAGVGRATAIAFARRGATLGLLARGHAGLDAAAADALAAGAAKVRAISVDVADAAAVDAAATAIEDELGPVTVWVNNAMVTVFSPIHKLTPDEIERVTRVTYLGQVHGTLAALKRMRVRNHGTIVNVSSALAFRGIPLQAAYCGAKFAVRGFSESLRTELLAEHSDVRVTLVHLPAVNTPQFGWCRSKLPGVHPQPVLPIYQPEITAEAIVRAADGGARSYTVGSWNRLIVMANALVPGVLDHFIARTGQEGQTAHGLAPDPADDLFRPEDEHSGTDRGAHGRFDTSAHGVLDRSFVRSLPHLLRMLGLSVVSRSREILVRPRRAAAPARRRGARRSRIAALLAR